MKKVKAKGHTIEVSNPGKVIFPDSGITKWDIVRYYQRISSHILPHLKNRPLVMHRYPDGIEGVDFYQKEKPGFFPDWIEHFPVKLKTEERKQNLVNCDNQASLLYLASQVCITPHVWLSKGTQPGYPDKLVFDLDPPKGDFNVVVSAAMDLREIFEELGLKVFAMTTGSEGMHLVLPLDAKTGFDESRDFAKQVAEILTGRRPEKYTTETLKKKRNGKLFIDYLRNSYGQTSVAPYAVRARKNAPIATPLRWDEIGKDDLSARSYHMGNIFKRLAQVDDPWEGYFKDKNNLKRAQEKLSEWS
jgi:bifunctional non-homologous end joining protein LigD